MALKKRLEEIIKNAKEKGNHENARWIAPKAACGSAVLASFFLARDIASTVDMPLVVDASFFLVSSFFFGSASYFVSERIAYNFLFKGKKLEDKVDLEAPKDKRSIGARVKDFFIKYNPLSLVLDHPHITALMLTGNKIRQDGIIFEEGHLGNKIFYLATYMFIAAGFYIMNPIINPRYHRYTLNSMTGGRLSKEEHYDEGINYLKKAIDITPTKEAYFRLAEAYTCNGDVDIALKICAEGMKIRSKKHPYDKFLDKLILAPNRPIDEYKSFTKGIRKKPKEVSNYFNLATLHWRLPSRHLSYEVMETAEERFSDYVNEEEFSNYVNVKCLYALMLDEAGDQRAEEKWTDTVDTILRNPDKKFEKVAESSNEVLEYALDEFIRGVFVFKKGDKKDLESEIELATESQKLVEESKDYKTVRPLRIFKFKEEEKEEKVYVMKRDEGEKLYFLEDKDIDLFLKVTDFLALIHAKFPSKKSKKGRIDIPVAVRDKLTYRDLNLPEKLINRVLDNYVPVYDSFIDAIYVFNKDANPENWVIGKDRKIIAIDWEDKGLVPMQFDLVNLLEYNGVTLKDEQKDKIIEEYTISYNKYKEEEIITDIDKFRLCYFNAVVQRVISLCSAWSSLDRPTMREKRGIILDNAINALRRLKEEYNEYYTQYKTNYGHLGEALEEIKVICSST